MASFFDESCGTAPVRKANEASPVFFTPAADPEGKKNGFSKALRWLGGLIQKDLGEEPSLGGVGRSLFTMFLGYLIMLLPLIILLFLGVDFDKDPLAIAGFLGILGIPLIIIGGFNLMMSLYGVIYWVVTGKEAY